MISRDDYTPEEWKALIDLPTQAALSVIASGRSGPLQLVKEYGAISTAIDDARASPYSLVVAVAYYIASERDEQAAVLRPGLVPEQDVEKLKAEMVSLITTVNQILAAKTSPDEADGYKRWVIEVARKTAEGAKEGGLLGIGGTRVSAEEQATLAELASALGVADSPR